MPTVDVVIPCYNYGHYLPACVDSALSQPGVDVRVLVIDDCSTDDSADVAKALADRDGRVEAQFHAVNRGHIATYNEGLIDWATGDYVVLISADDLLAPGSLQRACRIMDADPRIGMVYGRAPYFERNDDLPPATGPTTRTSRWDGIDWIERRCRAGHNVISSPEVVVRRTIQQQVGGYRGDLPHAGDFEMWLRIGAVSDIAFARGAPQAYYRVHDASMQRTIYSTTIDDLRQRRDVFQIFFDDHPDLPHRTRFQGLAARAIATEALWRACRAYDRDDVDQVPVDELVELAFEVMPSAGDTREFKALQRRKRLGATWCHRTQIFIAPAIWRRMKSVYRFERWKRLGE